jgi:hypothetical protein
MNQNYNPAISSRTGWRLALGVPFLLAALLFGMVGPAGDADAKKVKRATPKITIDDWGGGTVAGDVISKNYVCGIPGKVTVFKAQGKKPNRNKDRALKSTKVTGSDIGPFWRVDGLAIGVRVYAVFARNKRCKRAVSRTIVTKPAPPQQASVGN